MVHCVYLGISPKPVSRHHLQLEDMWHQWPCHNKKSGCRLCYLYLKPKSLEKLALLCSHHLSDSSMFKSKEELCCLYDTSCISICAYYTGIQYIYEMKKKILSNLSSILFIRSPVVVSPAPNHESTDHEVPASIALSMCCPDPASNHALPRRLLASCWPRLGVFHCRMLGLLSSLQISLQFAACSCIEP